VKRILAIVSFAACASDFPAASLLAADEPRVLAIDVRPLDAQPGETVSLAPFVYVPPGGAAPTLEWRFCPLTGGPQSGYTCLSPACETRVASDAEGRAIVDPTALALACLQSLGATGAPGAGTSTGTASLPEKVEMILTLRATTALGVRESIARLPYYPRGAPLPRNRAPVITRVTIGGTFSSTTTPAAAVTRGTTVDVAVTIDEASLDGYVDVAGLMRTEEPVVSFYTSAGEWRSDRASGLVATNTLDLAEVEAAEIEIFVVVRDGRGGQAPRGRFLVPLR